MNTFVVNKTSWHYRFLICTGVMHYELERRDNFCAYWRLVVWKLFVATVGALAGILLIGLLVYALYITPWVVGTMALQVLLFLMGIILPIALWTYLEDKLKSFNKSAKSGENTSLLATKYKSFKDKVCPSIEYK